MILLSQEFTSNDRNPNVNGNRRSLTVTQNGDSVRIVVSGEQGRGLNTKELILSDVTVSLQVWEVNKDLILQSLPRENK